MPLALILRAHTTALAIPPILGMGLCVKVSFFYIQLRNLIMYVLLNVTKERVELVIQILNKDKHKSLFSDTLANYCNL